MIGEVVVTMILSAAYSSRIHLFNYAPLQKKNFHREWLPVTIFFGLDIIIVFFFRLKKLNKIIT